ncbi:hypothetical protein PF007_g1538 [Phytophthora fragariae]|uniref:Uncharacterized protein n=1 Tax=Phytophthora fragariae TaxID=53985 RepID=A0A6A3UUR5_9STRA|nr:hypothetical protein PF003_g19846 [Phytophthora fragariae]KAE9029509.1 hypothetical protein PF011_g1051 [Phytophthora fragariae]KAE9138053.1 hypothetical protein PF007_g1538 [Phytophthora fragariae]KAE9154687.1 hypothetical protein PF006_g1287 [Phytophthora fragariae]KAE9328509.1 hypothetical protein PF001_g1338 [Phytophthora fragariae]
MIMSTPMRQHHARWGCSELAYAYVWKQRTKV